MPLEAMTALQQQSVTFFRNSDEIPSHPCAEMFDVESVVSLWVTVMRPQPALGPALMALGTFKFAFDDRGFPD